LHSCLENIHHLRLFSFVLLLKGRERELFAQTAAQLLPQTIVGVLIPRENADPGLHVVVQAQCYVLGLGDLARRVCDLILGALVLEGEFAPIRAEVLVG